MDYHIYAYLENILNVNIIPIKSSDLSFINIGTKKTSAKKYVVLIDFDGKHFEPVVRLTKLGKSTKANTRYRRQNYFASTDDIIVKYSRFVE